MSGISLTLNETLTTFNSTERLLTAPVGIGWEAPEHLHGVLEEYTVLLEGPQGVVVLNESTEELSVSTVLQLLPSEDYTVTVTVVTGGGMNSASFTFTAPEAGESFRARASG